MQGLLAVATAAHLAGLRQLAGLAAGWFFGANPANTATYNPATGATDDGVSADGTLNLNSGAESTIHGLLTMETLDANPDVAAIAHASAHILLRDGQRTIEAESADLTGPAAVVPADPAWTGESQWSGGAYVQLAAGQHAVMDPSLPPTNPDSCKPSSTGSREPAPSASSRHRPEASEPYAYGGGGAQGVSPAPGALLPVTLGRFLPASAVQITANTSSGTGQLDAVQLTPLVASLITTGNGHSVALLNSEADTQRARTVLMPGTGLAVARSYDNHGRLWHTTIGTDPNITVPYRPADSPSCSASRKSSEPRTSP